ncbi:hypothetical protein RB195_013219 [Necator americanus]|uniref:Nematode cuticle collagen N-terminal domain-containing protein n=1 Tax=Necator americanus TaxID=51031 RepID=A0ABR1DUI3_NECAM
MKIENFSQYSQYNGEKLSRPDMSDLEILRRTYRLYLAVALAVITILIGTIIILAVLLYQKIHRLDEIEDDLEICQTFLVTKNPLNTT